MGTHQVEAPLSVSYLLLLKVVSSVRQESAPTGADSFHKEQTRLSSRTVNTNTLKLFPFSLPVQMYKRIYCTTPSVSIEGGGISMDIMLKFYVKVF